MRAPASLLLLSLAACTGSTGATSTGSTASSSSSSSGSVTSGSATSSSSGSPGSSSSAGPVTATPLGLAQRDVTRVLAIPGSTSTWLAVTDQGLWRTTDAGATWSVLDPTSPIRRMWRVGSALLGGTDELSLLRSIDGMTWLPTTADAGDLNIRHIMVSPGGKAFALGFEVQEGFFTSADDGLTWSHQASPMLGGQRAMLNDLAIDAQSESTWYAATSQGFYVSTDAGTSWTASNAGLGSIEVWRVIAHPSVPGTLLTFARNAGAFRSVDSGGTWTPSLADVTVGIFPTVSEAIDHLVWPSQPFMVIGGAREFHSTRDLGLTWTTVATDIYPYPELGVDPLDDNAFLCGSGSTFGGERGIYRAHLP